MKKRMLAVLLASVTACSLGGCAGEKKDTVRTVKIGLTLYDQYDTFISELVSWFNASASALEEETGTAINVEVVDAAGSQTTQNEQVKSLIEKGCDVICVNLVDRTEPTTITDMAEKNDVPIIFFNRELVAEDLERWEKLYYVGADAFGSGIIEGELAAETFQSDPKYDKNGDDICQYVVLEGEAGHQDAIVRTEYSVNTLVEKGVKAEKLGYAIANWKRAQAQTKMTTLLEQYGERIELILANNDDMALGAIDALKASELPKDEWPIIVGIDGTDVGYYQFSPLFVNPSRFKGEGYRDIPLLANREVRLSKTVLDNQGKPVMGEDGKPMRDTVYAMPAQIKGALDEARSRYLQAQAKTRDERTLAQRASDARSGASELANEHAPFDSRNR